MNIKNRYTVKIEKMIYGGNSLARNEGFPIFIKSGCPGDVAEIEITKVNKNFAEAVIVEIKEASIYRIKPKCALHNVCGSCNWQYIEYKEQLNQKQNIVKETIKNITGHDYEVKEVIPSPLQYEYRCKIQLPVSQTKVSNRILAGYYKENSHELINIKYCHMYDAYINKIVDYIKISAKELNISGYDEKSNKGLLRHIVIRKSSDNSEIIVIFVINSKKIDKNLDILSKNLISKFSEIKGVCANINTNKTNVIMSNKTITICGRDYYFENMDEFKYKVSANSFFQVNPMCARLIFNKVKELIKEKVHNPSILDAYSGVSSFGVWLNSVSSKITCIEEVISASNDAKDNIQINNADNIEIINGDAEKIFQKLIENKMLFDVSIVDPPRKGCSEKSIYNLVKLTKKYIVYVSCNISTLARDMKLLENYDYFPVYIQPADMFPNTYHIETIVLFEKSNKKRSTMTSFL